jgi:hypothetical protein
MLKEFKEFAIKGHVIDVSATRWQRRLQDS